MLTMTERLEKHLNAWLKSEKSPRAILSAIRKIFGLDRPPELIRDLYDAMIKRLEALVVRFPLQFFSFS